MVKYFLEQNLHMFQIVMLKYFRVPVSAQMFMNMCYKMTANFTDITGVTSCTQFLHNTRGENEWDSILHTEHAANFEHRDS